MRRLNSGFQQSAASLRTWTKIQNNEQNQEQYAEPTQQSALPVRQRDRPRPKPKSLPVEGLQNILAITFQDQDKSKDIIGKTWNELDVERQNWVSAYLENMRFLVSPEGAEVKERKPSLRLGAQGKAANRKQQFDAGALT